MSFLDELIASTRRRVAETKTKVTEGALEQRVASASPARDLAAALRAGDVAIIAEIKRATPSAGVLDAGLDAGKTARLYAEGGAAAISVLTEPDRFLGSLEDLQAATEARLPLLRKDFVLDPFQVLESRAYGVDAVLLIVRMLDDPTLGSCFKLAESLGMQALVEVHDEDDVDRGIRVGAGLIGVNHRDLETFEVDPDRTERLAARVPSGTTLVALSGVSTREDVARLRDVGAHAVLVGEALVTAPDPVATLRELRGVA